jgi:hypothetical protein
MKLQQHLEILRWTSFNGPDIKNLFMLLFTALSV